MKIVNFSRLAIQLTYFLIFAEASTSKWMGGSTPEWFLSQFEKTALGTYPALLPFFYWGIALSETAIALLFFLSLYRKEHKSLSVPLLRLGLVSSQFLFVGLMLGLRLSHKYDDAAFLFLYALGSFLYLQHLIPRNPTGGHYESTA